MNTILKKLKRLYTRLFGEPELTPCEQVIHNLKDRVHHVNAEVSSLRDENVRLNHLNFNLELEIKRLTKPTGLPTL